MDTGIVRKLDQLGRVVIPAETRRLFNIREGDLLSISVADGHINMQKLEATCTFCGSKTQVHSFHTKGVCSNCIGDCATLRLGGLG